MRLETRTSVANNDIALRMMLTYFLLFTQITLANAGVESMKSVKSAHSCAIRIPRTIPAITPIEKISSISLICYYLLKCVPLAWTSATGLEARVVSKIEE